MNEDQVMHAMTLDDAYHVECVLAEGQAGITERVTIDGIGPFVRKRVPAELANRTVWAALADCTCPRLPQVALSYEAPGAFVVIYDFVPGNTLEHAMANEGSLSATEAADIALDLCEALSDLHAHGIAHCDISPTNIILAADGAHLIDFGNARIIGGSPAAEEPRSKTPLGTWGFAAPEQYGFAKADARTDIYALARLLGHMLTGSLPDGPSFEALLKDEGKVSANLSSIIRQGSSFEPSTRFQTANAFAQALKNALAYDNAPPRTTTAPQNPHASTSTCPPPIQKPQKSTQSKAPIRENQRSSLQRNAAIVATCILGAGLALAIAGNLAGKLTDTLDDSLSSNQNSSTSTSAPIANTEDSSLDATDSSTDTTPALPRSTAGKEESNSVQDDSLLTIAESGYAIIDGYVYYGVGIKNESNDTIIEYPELTVTGRAADGSVVFSSEQYLTTVYPGQTLYFGMFAGNGTAPTTVEFHTKAPAFTTVGTAQDAPVYRTSGVRKVSDGIGWVSFAGEITCENDDEVETYSQNVAVTIILRDESGNIIYGMTDFVSRPKKGESTAFEMICGEIPEYSSVEAYAQPW